MGLAEVGAIGEELQQTARTGTFAEQVVHHGYFGVAVQFLGDTGQNNQHGFGQLRPQRTNERPAGVEGGEPEIHHHGARALAEGKRIGGGRSGGHFESFAFEDHAAQIKLIEIVVDEQNAGHAKTQSRQ